MKFRQFRERTQRVAKANDGRKAGMLEDPEKESETRVQTMPGGRCGMSGGGLELIVTGSIGLVRDFGLGFL